MKSRKEQADHDNEICNGMTHDKRFPYNASQCSNKAWKDGFCKIHHPEEKRRKHSERMNKKQKLWESAERERDNKPSYDDLNTQLLRSKQREKELEESARLIEKLYNDQIEEIHSLIVELQAANRRIKILETELFSKRSMQSE